LKLHISARLRDTGPPGDPVAAALARLPEGVAEAWFSAPLKPAAVLIPLIECDDGLSVLFTVRTEHVSDHAGQISFPGGRVETGDRDPAQTALRESCEEIGLAPEQVDLAGYLEPLAVVSGYAVVPVIGFVSAGFRPRPDPLEVADVFDVPLSFLLDPANRRDVPREHCGVRVPMCEFQYQGHRIWGATAKMLGDFIDKIY